MSAPRISVDEWHKRLADRFKVNGLVGGNLRVVHEAEDHVSNYLVKTFRGQNALLDSFQSLLIETLTLANSGIVSNGWPRDASNYSTTLAAFSNLFRRFRACEVLYMKGYPLDGYALMRDIKDRALLMAAIARNMATFPEILGATAAPVAEGGDYGKEATKRRKASEHRIMHSMVGKDSGLPVDVQKALKQWDDLFHVEVHGGAMSLIQELGELASGRAVQIGPSAIQDAYTMYINRSAELGWMVARLLPYLQTTENAFGQSWHEKREVLDDSFRYLLEGLSDMGKKIGAAFIAMMDSKFMFKAPFYYSESDGSQLPGAQAPS